MLSLKRLNARVAVLLLLSMIASGCGSVVQIRPPYDRKIRIGDRVHAFVSEGVLNGEVVYFDGKGLVLKTGKKVEQRHPVKAFTLTSYIDWKEIKQLKVEGVLDRSGNLIGEEEIRVNQRTNLRGSFMLNVGILGFASSFGLGVFVQDRMFPPLKDKPISSLSNGRAAFWMTWVGGTLISAVGGYWVGRHIDRNQAIQRIERQRGLLQQGPSSAQAHP